jgi:hypothetical protein
VTHRHLDPTLAEEVLAALSIAGSIILSPLLRPWYRHWGARPAETTRPLPGDDLVPHPKIENTRTVTVQATPADIWPWLVQLGQGRGGLYSYTRLENLVGCDLHNADRILPEHQNPSVGDTIRLAPEGAPFYVVAALEPERALVLKGGGPQLPDATLPSWVFCLDPLSEGSTRLIARNRLDYPPGVGNFIMWRVIIDPMYFIMERRMLLGIKQRAEAGTGQSG